MTDREIIGIDHGNAFIKTVSSVLPNGITEYEYEPFTGENMLEYGDRYYVCGSGRTPLQKDKTRQGGFYLMTLAAIAKELQERNGSSRAEVIVAAGLPLTSFGRDKEKFRSYLLRDSVPEQYCFEYVDYKITIKDVLLYPQGYAAILPHMDKIAGEPSVIVCDIGGWTVDVMRLDNAIPNAETCRSLELGMIRCQDEIIEQVRRNAGVSLTAAQVETVLAGNPCSINGKAREIVLDYGRRYTQKLMSAISESGFDAGAMPIVFLGGGAGFMQRNITEQDNLCNMIVIDDVCANAVGYEYIANQLTLGMAP